MSQQTLFTFPCESVTFQDFLQVQKTAKGSELVKNDRHDQLIIVAFKNHIKDTCIGALKGAVFDKTTKALIAPSFPSTLECLQRDFFTRQETQDFNFTVYPAFEGVLLKVFHHQDTWHMVTQKNPDAFLRANWADKTHQFGQTLGHRLRILAKVDEGLFLNAEECKVWCMDEFDKSLDKTLIYYWLLRHTDLERVVSQGLPLEDAQAILSVGQRDVKKNFAFEWYPKVKIAGVSLHVPDQIVCKSHTHLETLLDKVDVRHQAGFLCVNQVSGDHYKVLSTSYGEKCALRDNTADIELAYLKVRGNIEHRQAFLTLYPEIHVQCDRMERKLHVLGHRILEWIRQNSPVPASKECCNLPQRDEPVFDLTPCRHLVHKHCIVDNMCHICRAMGKRRTIDTQTEVKFPGGEPHRQKRELIGKVQQHFRSYALANINRDNIFLFLTHSHHANIIYQCLPLVDRRRR